MARLDIIDTQINYTYLIKIYMQIHTYYYNNSK